jgi:hypothetical protein
VLVRQTSLHLQQSTHTRCYVVELTVHGSQYREWCFPWLQGWQAEQFVDDTGRCRNWHLFLSDREKRALLYYSLLWLQRFGVFPESCADCIFNLGDNPWSRVNWSASGSLPCYRRNGKFYSPFLGRWLLVRECWASLGLPVYPALADAAQTVELEMPVRGSSAMLGNAMHVPSVGIVILIALASSAPATG